MMKRLSLPLLAVLLIAFFSACQNERAYEVTEETSSEVEEVTSRSHQPEMTTNVGVGYPGEVIIKLKESANKGLEISKAGELQLNSVPSPMATALNKIGATEARRLFRHAGKYEERSRREGMHLWYIVKFDKNVSLTTAVSAMSVLDEVEVAEVNPEVQLMSTNPSQLANDYGFNRPTKHPFNDPLLPQQWHYNNLGTARWSQAGSDVNLYAAWEIETGSPEVIVCVVDGGLDVNHEDLIGNIWVNEAEANGQPGVDDDLNGYKDDINGYCFVANTGNLVPDRGAHGVHVAGTVAARNNNGIGVAGVAGGDGTPNSGIRLMGASIFRAGAQGASPAEAIKYGADNGAVISQNSWGYPIESRIFTTPSHIKKAIDYFTKYAGCDNDGNQLPNSPMKGGLVIFAAGNDDAEYTSQPAEYHKNIAVAAIGPDFKRASYSNWGKWVDISAPGGDQDTWRVNESGVLSTVSPDYVLGALKYDWFQGTSMACPHVSGIAALAVSHRGGQGFTNEKLRTILLASVLPISIDEVNPDYAGKLGSGYIDAYAALTIEDKGFAPEVPQVLQDKSNEQDFTSITVYWTVPKDEDDGMPLQYALYFSEEILSANNYNTKGTSAFGGNGRKNGYGLEVGSEMSHTIKFLKPGTKYYFALVAYDRWGHKSDVNLFSLNTKVNTPPTITNIPAEGIQLLDVMGKTTYEFLVEDIDGHSWTYQIKGDLSGVSRKQTKNGIEITIRPVLDEGEYSFTLIITDELGDSSEFNVPFQVIRVKEPKLISEIPSVAAGVANEAAVVNLPDFFEPQKYLTLTYSASSSNEGIVTATLDQAGKLQLKAVKPGRATINVEVTNGHLTTRTSFNVTVTQDASKDVYSIWPLPITDVLNIWLNPKHKSATVKMIAPNGQVVLEKQAGADPNNIAQVSMKGIAPGTYTIQIETGGAIFRQSVLKR